MSLATAAANSVSANVISEAYRSRRFSRFGFLDWSAARTFAERIIADYDVKCPSPEARVRLLSGGNMQKLILGRALDGEPAVALEVSKRPGENIIDTIENVRKVVAHEQAVDAVAKARRCLATRHVAKLFVGGADLLGGEAVRVGRTVPPNL